MKGEAIIQTEYVVRIVTPKGTPEMNLRLGASSRPRSIKPSAQPSNGLLSKR